MSKKYKIFYDTVHGNIKIPIDYCDKIIDTLHFQRLRRIEQTSMRSLFPCAHHDRFVHSIGTFYLGQKIFEHVFQNSGEAFKAISDEDIEKLKRTYEIACLLHDCGHAPFSHTFEKYYGLSTGLNDLLKKEAGDKRFSKDFEGASQSKEHERLSSYILLKEYRDIENFDAVLAARMIIGCAYNKAMNAYEELENCFISLLNGHIIDADRLDYICRDKWASGYSSANVNVERLLSAMSITISDKKEYYICFNKSAINEIHNLLNNKDYQYSSVISHHKVVYDQDILEKAVTRLMGILKEEANASSEKTKIKNLFNIESFFESTPIGIKENIYLPTDDDIVHLLKEHMANNSYAQEWFSRKHKLKPLWKSQAEYIHLFKNLRQDKKFLEKKGYLRSCVDEVIKKELRKNNLDEADFVVLDAKQSISRIQKDKLFLCINGTRVSYEELKLPAAMKGSASYLFYVYIPQDLLNNKFQIINSLIEGAKRKQKEDESHEKQKLISGNADLKTPLNKTISKN